MIATLLLLIAIRPDRTFSIDVPDRKSVRADEQGVGFTSNQRTWPVARIAWPGSHSATTIGNYVARQWLSHGSLVITKGSRVFTLGRIADKPLLVLDMNVVIPGLLDSDPVNLICGFNSTGKKLAVTYDGNVVVVDVDRRSVVYSLSLERMEHTVVPKPEGLIDYGGVCWSSDDKAIAVAEPSSPDPGSTSGVGPPQCVVFSIGGAPKSLGLGSPISWISKTEILCLDETHNGLVRPAILSTARAPRKVYRGVGLEVGWDGKHVLLSHNHSVDIIDSRLSKKIRTLPLPGHDDTRGYWPHCPLISIPSYFARRA